MSTVSLPHTLTAGTPENINDVQANDEALRDAINGQLDGDNLTTATRQVLGLSDSSTVRRGKSIVATSESRNNAAYGLLTTPDRVQGMVLPTDGLIFVAYQAQWLGSGNARAAIFVGANQMKVALGDSVPVVQEVAHPGGGTPRYNNLATTGNGLATSGGTAVDAGDPVTTGQLVGLSSPTPYGGVAVIFAAAGTYDVSVQFKTTGVDAVTVKNRRLWAWTMGF